MKFLHIAATVEHSPGIEQQMEWEQQSADRLNLNWQTVVLHPSDNFPSELNDQRREARTNTRSLLEWIRLRARTARTAHRELARNDCVLLRYSPHDPFQLLLLAVKGKRTICLVHHTIEPKELSLDRSLLGRIRVMAELIIGPMAVRMSTINISVTPEIASFQAKRSGFDDRRFLVYPNGIDPQVRVCDDLRGAKVELLFVASRFEPWHGLDVLLLSVQQTKADFVLHVVGNVSEQTTNLALGDYRVVFHGRLVPSEIRALASRSWLGIASLALGRTGMGSACPLKVREYLALGLPVIGSSDDVFPEQFPYYKKMDVSINGIISAAHSWRGIDRRSVADASLPLISKDALLEKLERELTMRIATSPHNHGPNT